MSNMYCKCYASGRTVLYGVRGNVCGRGRTDPSGKTVFVDLNGKMIGERHDCPNVGAKCVDNRKRRVGERGDEPGFVGQTLIASAILLGLYVLLRVLAAL